MWVDLQRCAACPTPRLIPKGSNPVHSLRTTSICSLPGLGRIQQEIQKSPRFLSSRGDLNSRINHLVLQVFLCDKKLLILPYLLQTVIFLVSDLFLPK
jgi:hypothetical protein